MLTLTPSGVCLHVTVSDCFPPPLVKQAPCSCVVALHPFEVDDSQSFSALPPLQIYWVKLREDCGVDVGTHVRKSACCGGSNAMQGAIVSAATMMENIFRRRRST